MKTLIAGFEGDTNSAKILLDNIKDNKDAVKDVLYLKNDFEISAKQIEEKLNLDYDHILMFGQIPNTKNIYLERKAKLNKIKYTTDYDYIKLKEVLENNGYKVEISNNAGNYFCNNVFFSALRFKQNYNIKTKISFIHIPTMDNIESIQNLSEVILEYNNSLINEESKEKKNIL